METRANYVLIGTFTLAIVVCVFGFIYWFQNIGGTGQRAIYTIIFDGSVSGLRTGGTVLFNGIRIGEVTDLKLAPDRPKRVVATVSIDKMVPVRADTRVGLEFQGLTGIASVSLSGGTVTSPALTGTKENPATLMADPDATQDVTQAAREVLKRLDKFIAENEAAFSSALKNIDTFSAALARNSERLDKITEGLQNLTGGVDGKGGEINEAAKSVRRMTDTGTRTLTTIDKAVKNFDKNPSRIIWGGGSSMDDDSNKKKKTPAPAN